MGIEGVAGVKLEAGHLIALGLHLICQVAYTCMMLTRPYPAWRRAFWLFVIWGVPILGIGLAGSRFTHLKDEEHNS